jgi:tetratricopeptide (TPR) repeat protein
MLRSNRNGTVLIALTLALALFTERGPAQESTSTALTRALELESSGKYRDAVKAFREALADAPLTSVVLGLERVYYQLGQSDSLLPLLKTLLAGRPRDPTLRTVQLRTLVMLHRDMEAYGTFIDWANASPKESTPYREYARMLLEQNRIAGADSVLQLAARQLSSMQELSSELAQLRASMGLWVPSAAAWREALKTQSWLDQAAAYALLGTPPDKRDSLRAVLREPPIELGARRLLAALELRWNAPAEAWSSLREVPPNDSTVAAWVQFAEEVEALEAWAIARDAYETALKHNAPPGVRIRAAATALSGRDPAATIEFLKTYGDRPDTSVREEVSLLRARAYSSLGQPGAVRTILSSVGETVGLDIRDDIAREIAWAYVRSGQLDSAKIAIAETGDDPRARAWVALYEGDLQNARNKLRQLGETTADAVLAQALLSRTRVLRSAKAGSAFLALAQRDSLRAVDLFVSSASEVEEAAPLMLAAAARIASARPDSTGVAPRALALWERIVREYETAPEAAEADLEWARALRRTGNHSGAVARLEHLLLTYPQSALAPQARRELDLARNAIPRAQ